MTDFCIIRIRTWSHGSFDIRYTLQRESIEEGSARALITMSGGGSRWGSKRHLPEIGAETLSVPKPFKLPGVTALIREISSRINDHVELDPELKSQLLSITKCHSVPERFSTSPEVSKVFLKHPNLIELPFWVNLLDSKLEGKMVGTAKFATRGSNFHVLIQKEEFDTLLKFKLNRMSHTIHDESMLPYQVACLSAKAGYIILKSAFAYVPPPDEDPEGTDI